MAIAYLGFDQCDATGGNGNDTGVVIPSGATLAVAVQTFWDDAVAGNLATLVVDGQSAVFAEQNSETSINATACAIAEGFTTGTKTVSWTYNTDSAISEGGTIYILFFSGASATPVTSNADAQTASTACSMAMTNTATTEVAIVLGESFATTDPATTTPSGATQNLVVNNESINSHNVGVAYYTFSTSTAKTWDIGTEDYSALVGVIIAEAGAGAAGDNTIIIVPTGPALS